MPESRHDPIETARLIVDAHLACALQYYDPRDILVDERFLGKLEALEAVELRSRQLHVAAGIPLQHVGVERIA